MRTWFSPASPAGRQRGYPQPLSPAQSYAAAGAVPPQPVMFGGVILVANRRSDMGAAGYAPVFGRVASNPIGAGIVAAHRPQPSYGVAGQYLDHTIFWAQQTIPTSVPFASLTGPAQLAALLGTVNVQAAVRTA